MKLFIHDLEVSDFKNLYPTPLDDSKIISDDGKIHQCIGCFGCWIKTPAACVIRDSYGDMGENLSKCTELIIISKCCYGGFSPFVKNVLDRSISYAHPDFQIRNGQMHHRRRYNNHIDMKVWFYGTDITDKEKHTAEQLVKANCINLNCTPSKISFINSVEDIKGALS